MRELNVDNDSSLDYLLKEKFLNEQKKIDTIYTGRDGYTWWKFLEKWKTLLIEVIGRRLDEELEDSLYETIENWDNQEIDQIYFPPGSWELVLKKIEELLLRANKHIYICDPWFDKKLLHLIVNGNPINQKGLEIRILTDDKKGSTDIEELIRAFELLYDTYHLEVRRTKESHDRFYIIDDSAYSLWTSLQIPNKATLLTRIYWDYWKLLMDNYDGWWGDSNKHIN